MANFLDYDSLGKNYGDMKNVIRILLPALIETSELLNKQEIDSFFNEKLEKRRDSTIAKSANRISSKKAAREEMIGYLKGLLDRE